MKTRVPLWINILQIGILAILTFQTYAFYLDLKLIYPGMVLDAATAKAVYALAGRNAVMAAISLVALVRQDPRFYSFAFLMHSLRELQDMFIVPLTREPGAVAIGIFFVFLFAFVIPEIMAYFKLKNLADESAKR